MCLSPITIPSQTRYVSLYHSDPYLMDVACGHCAECASTIANQWYYRAWYEYNDLPAGGYCLFDCLTYAPKHLPHLSDFWSFLSKSENYPCFNYKHIRDFLQALDKRLQRKGYGKRAIRYFLSTEYGTDKSATHRPHIHLMLYVHNPAITPYYLSTQIADLWSYGRTDGPPYKSAAYLYNHNYVPASNQLANKLRTCRYVTKYVQKCCLFQDELDKRIVKVMYRMAEFVTDGVAMMPDEWLSTEYARRERLRLMRFVNQFHRQSQHFGESALGDVDLLQLERDGCLFMPDSYGVKIPIPLPTYYRRKLCQEQITIDGARYWIDTDYGKHYRQVRRARTKEILCQKFQCVVDQFKLKIKDVPKLVDYVFDVRGRIKGMFGESSLLERYQHCDLFNYATCSDKLQFGQRGLSPDYLGDSQRGFTASSIYNRIPLATFIERFVQMDDHYEHELDLIKLKARAWTDAKESVYRLKQELRNKFKPLLMI